MMPVLVDGMHGLGDNVHQRAIIRRLLAADRDVWLRTPWPCLYHDFTAAGRVHLLPPWRTLRTQAKNARREHARYAIGQPPRVIETRRVWYDPAAVRATGSVLGGMIRTTLSQGIEGADFTLPVPPEWRAKAAARMARPDRPIMVLRPLVNRREWDATARNPDPAAFAAIFNAIRSRFFVVSIADLSAGQEWIVGDELDADVTFHAGELDAEAIAGLMASAALTFCSVGFALVLSQAVGTPVVTVYGGRECSRFYAYGERFAPTLGIDPIRPCECFSHNHRCDKRIDVPAAHERVARFIEAHCHAAAPAPVIA